LERVRASGLRPLLATWVVTRILLVVFTGVRQLPHQVWFASAADVFSYQRWAELIVHTGAFPLHDDNWQYPPGAGALMLLPRVLPGLSYWWWFFALLVLVDGIGLGLLIWQGRARGTLTGAWVWTLGVALLGRICYGRFDLFVSVIAIAVLLCAVRRPAIAGAAIAVGVLLKVWPLALLVGIRRGRPLIAAASGALVVLAAVGGVLAAVVPGSWAFLRFQSERGVQIESVVATPLMLAHAFGAKDEVIAHRYGAEELIGPAATPLSRLCLALTAVAAVVLVLWWIRRRWTPEVIVDGAMFAVLLAMATSRVLSPQYFVWPLGMAAVAAMTRGSSQRPIVALVLVLAGITQLEYPFVYDQVARGTAAGALVLLLRNGLLVWATVWSGLRLWRCTRADGGHDRLRVAETATTLQTTA
jgi:hypothetical protein